MLKVNYLDWIYQVDGETIRNRPKKIFDQNEVYLLIDKEYKLIWIWAGSHSRLFHRYMAANWAGKLKTKQKFYNFKYEVIKQGTEPLEFHAIFNEIKQNKPDLDYPGESRHITIKEEYVEEELEVDQYTQKERVPIEVGISNAVKVRIKKIYSEIIEMHNHIKYSMEHIQERFTEIEKLLEI